MANFGGGSGVYGGKLAEECRSMKQIGDFSPMGLRVLVVDDDKLCLKVLEGMLRQCNYEVTTCCKITQAITMVKEGKDNFDLVMCEVYMPGEDGFELLEIAGLGLDLPVIMMSTNGDTTVVMKGITHGACDYLIKPIRIEALRNIWQHVLRRRGRDFLKEEIGECEDREAEDSPESSSRKRKDSGESGDEVIDDISSLKRARVHWTVQLHQQFVAAVNQLGIDKAVPKKIVEIMKVHGLSRENVASHLQKYRLYLKRLSGVVPEPYPVASFQAADDSVSGGIMKIQLRGKGSAPSSVVKGLNLGAGVNSNVGVRGLDKSTLTSLEQYRAYQQKLAANRAQVYGGLGICPSKASNAESFGECSKNSKNGLQRMCSVDLGLLWKVQQEQDEEKNNKLVIAGSGMPGLLPSGHKRSRENITLYDQLFEEEKSVSQLQSKRPIASEVAQTFQSTNVVTEYQNPVPVKSKLKNVDEMQPMEDISWISDAFKPESPKPMPAGPKNPLHRMSSIDMGLLWKVQQEQVAENNVKQDISLTLKQYARHLNVRSRTESVGSQSQVSGNLPTAPIQSATPAGDSQSNVPAKNPVHVVGEMHSLEDMSWLDEPFRPVSPRIDHSSGNLFDNFGQEGLGGQVSGPNANEANRQGFSELGLSDISDYLMDDYNPNNK